MRLPASALLLGLALSAAPALAQQVTMPLWPHATPEPPQTAEAEADVTTPDMAFISGHRTARLTNVTKPTLSVYPPPASRNTGAAALVFPGGGYQRLAWNGEGTDTCAWLNSIGMTCVLVKYRVPESGRYPDNYADLEDAQQAMRLTRAHANDWHIDPNRIGVIGFSAGAHLAILLSTHADDAHVTSTPAASDVNTSVDARANFALVIYPAYAAMGPGLTELDPNLKPNALTPPTFLLQSENDPVHVENALNYFRALKDAKIHAELIVFPTGGHGFGMHPIGMPAEHWTRLATDWLHTMRVLPTPVESGATGQPFSSPTAPPCLTAPVPTPPRNGRPATNPPPPATSDPNCW